MSDISREVSAQLRVILPELKKSIVEAIKREIASEIKNEVERQLRAVKSSINTTVEESIESTVSTTIDSKIDRAVKTAQAGVIAEVNKSQLALVKASHQDIRAQVSRDIANVVKEKIAPQLNNFIMSAAMNNADHTEMITEYRHGVDQNISKPARAAVRNQYAMAAGRGFQQRNNCALPPSDEKKTFTARFVLGDD